MKTAFTKEHYYYHHHHHLFNAFVNDICNVIKYSRYLLFADDIKMFRAVISADGCTLLQADIEDKQAWCAANCVKLNVSKTRAITFSRKTNGLYYVYKIQDSSLPRTDTIKDLDVQLDSKLHFHAQVDYIFSQSLRPLGLIRTLTYSFYTLGCLLLL